MIATRSVAPVILLAALGCASMGGVRPRFAPAAGALFELVDPPPRIVTRAMAQELERRGVPLLAVAEDEGYIETRWFDAASLAAQPAPFGARPEVVKLRLFADPVGRGTRLFLEAVTRVAWDPSLPERELERMVGEGHAVRPLLTELVAGLRTPRPPPLAPHP